MRIWINKTMDSSQSLNRQEFCIEQKRWAIAFLLTGCLTFFMASFVDPIFGSLFIILGIINLLVNGRGIFLINGVVLALLAGATLTGAINSAMSISNINILTIIGLVLGFFEGAWAVHEIGKFNKYRRQFAQSQAK
jgi:membrane-bound ClpP family serine protease